MYQRNFGKHPIECDASSWEASLIRKCKCWTLYYQLSFLNVKINCDLWLNGLRIFDYTQSQLVDTYHFPFGWGPGNEFGMNATEFVKWISLYNYATPPQALAPRGFSEWYIPPPSGSYRHRDCWKPTSLLSQDYHFCVAIVCVAFKSTRLLFCKLLKRNHASVSSYRCYLYQQPVTFNTSNSPLRIWIHIY